MDIENGVRVSTVPQINNSMNRTLKHIEVQKWYHLETLKKFYADWQMQLIPQIDNNNNEFTFVSFKHLWKDSCFIMHPKTKRLRLVTLDAYREVGFNA